MAFEILTAVLTSLSKLAFWSLNALRENKIANYLFILIWETLDVLIDLELSSIFVSVLYLTSMAAFSHSASRMPASRLA